MHPCLQLVPDFLHITPHALRHHRDQPARLPRRLHHSLAPRPPDLIIRHKRIGNILRIV